MQEQELFQGYEVKNWDFSPRLYKILIFSAIFNVLALLVVAQSNLLTMKGCESPLVGGVCQVLDTLYVGGTALTASKDYIDQGYVKTELTSDDEIVWIPVGDEPFKYPDGYRQLANPELFAQPMPTEMQNEGSFPIIPGTNPTLGGGTDLTKTTPVLPPDIKNPVSDLPTSPYSIGDNPTLPKQGKTTRYKTPKQKNQKNPTLTNESPANLPDLTGGNTQATNTNTNTNPQQKDKVAEIVINKKPMRDFAVVVREKYDKKEVDLSQNFKVVAVGVLTKDGKLDVTLDKNKLPKSRVTVKEGNPEMVAIAEQAIAAIGDSGWLGYLKNQGVEIINFTVVQDNDNLQVIITSDFPTPERANTITSGVGGAISGRLLADKNTSWKLGDDERVLLTNAKVAVNPQNTRQFVLNFVLPKPVAQEMITRKLKEPVEPNSTQEKTNGNSAQVKTSNQTTAK